MLGHISLFGKGITDVSAKAVAEHCPYLKYVTLWRCCDITDSTLTAFASRCQLLTCINLLGCPRITKNGVQAIANGCKHIVRMMLIDERCARRIPKYSEKMTIKLSAPMGGRKFPYGIAPSHPLSV